MAKYRIDISEPAENDLRDIVRYISAQLSAPVAAQRMMDIFEDAIAELTDMPHKYPYITDARLAALGYHKLIVKNYIVFYTIDENLKVINVERILFTRRDWIHIL